MSQDNYEKLTEGSGVVREKQKTKKISNLSITPPGHECPEKNSAQSVKPTTYIYECFVLLYR